MATYEQLPGRLDLKFKSGDYFSTEVDFSIPLTGYTISAAAMNILTGTIAGSFSAVITDVPAGKVNISLTTSQTSAMSPGTYLWRLQWTTASGQVRTALEGYVEVS